MGALRGGGGVLATSCSVNMFEEVSGLADTPEESAARDEGQFLAHAVAALGAPRQASGTGDAGDHRPSGSGGALFFAQGIRLGPQCPGRGCDIRLKWRITG